jgi:hypothetical protein
MITNNTIVLVHALEIADRFIARDITPAPMLYRLLCKDLRKIDCCPSLLPHYELTSGNLYCMARNAIAGREWIPKYIRSSYVRA